MKSANGAVRNGDLSGSTRRCQRHQRSRALVASARVSSAASHGRERLAACPDQSGENSLEPDASAAVLIGTVALAAVGNAGASGAIGPISRTIRFATPRAGRP